MITITHIDENTDTDLAWEAVDSDHRNALGWGATPDRALNDLRQDIAANKGA